MLVEPPYAVYVMSYNGCELHCCHLDGYKGYREAFARRLAAIEGHFAALPRTRRQLVWFNVDETALDEGAIQAIAEGLGRMQPHIVKIAFVGVPRLQRPKFSRALQGMALPHQFFSDAEKAKEWLA